MSHRNLAILAPNGKKRRGYFSFAESGRNLQIQRWQSDMLTTLRIKNLALVADLTLELQPGYNVITGETGAGKSILIGALSLVLGERAERTLIRSGSESCSVEAVFDVARLKAPLESFLEESGLEPCEDHQLVLRRAFTNAGANRQFINGSPTTLNTLATLGEWLVDIHGPHDHQSLLHPARQLAILDAFGKLDSEREGFAGLVRRRAAIEAEKAALIVDEKTYAQQLDLLRFQVEEIAAARLQPEEEQQVDQDYRRAANAAKLLQLSQAALDVLSENDNSLLTQTGVVGRALQELQRVDSTAAPLAALHEQAVSVLHDLQAELSRYAEKVEVDPARLQQLEDRLTLIQSLKRKYGAGVAEVIAFGEEARRKLESLEQRDAELIRLNAELQLIEAELWQAGQALSAKRRKVIPQLSKAVSKQLADLGFKQSRFDATLSTLDPAPPAAPHASRITHHLSHLTASGLDAIEFQFAPNPGEPMRPLRAIASSGELARVMLALKTVLAAEDQIPVLVFDEVDANVGGETAHAVGEKMRQIAQKRQVLCITHLPQVAAPAFAHYVVTKQVRAGRTTSEITLLDRKERVTELARMLGGQTDAARKHAEALIDAVS
jgi:DNA repair protein RecN (Recombination protein N)